MTFLILDDHDIIRTGVKNMLGILYPSCTVHTTANEKEFLPLFKTISPDLIIMDVHLPDLDTPGLMEYIHTQNPAQKVIVFSMCVENIYGPRFIKAGAMGFVSKTSHVSELERAIRLALENRRYMSSHLAELVLMGNSVSINPFEKLTAREFDIAMSMIKGKSVGEISETFNISSSTVSTIKSNVFKKLMVSNIAGLMEIGQLYNIQDM